MVYASLPDVIEMIYELTAVEYGYNANMQIVVEKTEDIKRRIKLSPDLASALIMTMADSDKIARMLARDERPVKRVVKNGGLGAWT